MSIHTAFFAIILSGLTLLGWHELDMARQDRDSLRTQIEAVGHIQGAFYLWQAETRMDTDAAAFSRPTQAEVEGFVADYLPRDPLGASAAGATAVANGYVVRPFRAGAIDGLGFEWDPNDVAAMTLRLIGRWSEARVARINAALPHAAYECSGPGAAPCPATCPGGYTVNAGTGLCEAPANTGGGPACPIGYIHNGAVCETPGTVPPVVPVDLHNPTGTTRALRMTLRHPGYSAPAAQVARRFMSIDGADMEGMQAPLAFTHVNPPAPGSACGDEGAVTVDENGRQMMCFDADGVAPREWMPMAVTEIFCRDESAPTSTVNMPGTIPIIERAAGVTLTDRAVSVRGVRVGATLVCPDGYADAAPLDPTTDLCEA